MAIKHNFLSFNKERALVEVLSEYCENTVDTSLTPLQCPRHEMGAANTGTVGLLTGF